jgi:hypothetical protein
VVATELHPSSAPFLFRTAPFFCTLLIHERLHIGRGSQWAGQRAAESNEVGHGRATEEGCRTGIPASTLWVSAAGKRPRTQHHMAQLKMSLV